MVCSAHISPFLLVYIYDLNIKESEEDSGDGLEFLFKVMVIGHSGSGKTSMFMSFYFLLTFLT